MVITIYMANIFKKGLSYLAKKLQKYVPIDDNKDIKNKIENIDNNNKNTNINEHTKNLNVINKNNNEKLITNTKTNNNTKINNNDFQKQESKEILKNEYEIKQEPKIYTVEQLQNKINTIWDILRIKENTQAEHLIKVIPSDQWIDMEEIKQRIKLEFNIEYKNEKSLYPYLKTLTDINLIKLNNTGKKRSWKKNIIIIE
jgi:transposase